MPEEKPKTPRRRKSQTVVDPSSTEPQKITIEVTRFKSLFDALDSPKKVFRVVVTVFLIGVLLFGGITLIALSMKRIYPYNDIVINAFGATTVKNEKQEVSYWLLNTAELWSNSGIVVRKGQTITVRASGKKHTAIHHLMDDAKNNAPLREPWVGTGGFSSDSDTRNNGEKDKARARYRIFPGENQDALLMQIVPLKSSSPANLTPVDKGSMLARDKDRIPPRIILVGDELKDIYIDEDGVLFFAINDIVLNDETITEMLMEVVNANVFNGMDKPQRDSLVKKKCKVLQDIRKEWVDAGKSDTIYNQCYEEFKSKLGQLVANKDNKYGQFELGNGSGDLDGDKIELFGYFMRENKTPWYDDNLGSFLILVESRIE